MANPWIKNTKAPASDTQKRTIRGILRYKGLNEGWLYAGIKKYINALTMGEADQVIKKLSAIKINKGANKNGK